MATPIRIKRSAVSGKKPQNIDLQVGELALNTYDGSLFTKRDTGGVGIATTVSNITPWVENFGGTSINYSSGDVGIGSDNPKSKLDINGSLNVSGVSTFSSNINLLDGISAKFGTDLDGEIKHTGNNLQIQETTGNIQITNYANDKDVDITSDDGSGSTALYFKADGSTGETILYNYGSEKIKTTSTGVSITGTIDTDQLNVSGVSTFTGDITANGNIVGDDSTNISGIASVTATTFHGSGANLTSLNATNLTGTINGARLPNPLPAISGQNLTDITADGLSGSPNINVSNIVGTALSVSGISTFNGDLLIEDSIIHVGDPNTKIRFPIDNEVSIETAGDERLRINSSGQVSVGTEPSSGQGLFNIKPSSGDEFFKVRDAGAFDASLNGVAVDIRNAANNTSKDLLVRSENLVLWQSGAEKLRIGSNGYVNIGSGTAEEQLTIRNTTQHCLIRLICNSASTAGIDFGDAEDTDIGRVRYYHSDGSNTNFMRFDVNASEKLRIASDGKLSTNCSSDSTVKFDVDDSIWWWNTNTGLAPNTSRTWTITGIFYGGAKIVIGGGDGNYQRAGAVIEVVGTMWSTAKVYYHHETIKSSSGASISTTYNNNSIAITVASSSNWWYYSMTIEQSKRSGASGVSVTVS